MTDADYKYLCAADVAYSRECDLRTPAMMLRPRVFIDGDKWCALYGEDIQDGVAGFGDSPELAFSDFNRAWSAPLPARGR